MSLFPPQIEREGVFNQLSWFMSRHNMNIGEFIEKHVSTAVLKSCLRKAEEKLDGAPSISGPSSASIESIYNTVASLYRPSAEVFEYIILSDSMIKVSSTLDTEEFMKEFDTACECIPKIEVTYLASLFNFGLYLKRFKSLQPKGWADAAGKKIGKDPSWIRRILKTTLALEPYISKLRRCSVSFTLLHTKSKQLADLFKKQQKLLTWWTSPEDDTMPPLLETTQAEQQQALVVVQSASVRGLEEKSDDEATQVDDADDLGDLCDALDDRLLVGEN